MPRGTDVMIRASAADGYVRAFAVNGTRLCERARRVQDTLPPATAALGRVLCATAMLSATIKEGERIALRIESTGPIGGIYAQATPDGRIRGYVKHPHVVLPVKAGKLDVGGATMPGELMVVRDLGMREPYLGRVPLQSGEIGDDLAYYFAVSEQLPSAVGLGVLVNTDDRVAAAGGYLIQLLPGASEAVIAHLEANITAAPRPSDLILHLRDPARVLDVLLDGLGWRELARLTPRYSCGCTRAKSRRALAALPALELRQMAAGDEPAEVLCEFCGKRYRFTPAEMAGLTVRKI